MLRPTDKRYLEQLLKLADTDTSFIATNLMQQIKNAVNAEKLNISFYATSMSASNSQLQQESRSVFDTLTYASSSEGRKLASVFDDSETSNIAVQDANEREMNLFRRNEYKFLYTLRHTVFEDGCNNEATNLFDSMLQKNKYVAISWLYEFWCDHQDDPIVFEGLIRLIGRITDKGYWKTLFSIVRNGFSDNNPEIQEAAIMVAESWRTKACLVALSNTSYESPWIRNYANQVIEELKEELANEIH